MRTNDLTNKENRMDYYTFTGQKLFTQLIRAVTLSNLQLVKHLLEKGYNPDETNDFGMSPLMYASGQGNIEIVRLLLKNGANINLKDMYGYTALQHALEENQEAVIHYLMEKGAHYKHPFAKNSSLFPAAFIK